MIKGFYLPGLAAAILLSTYLFVGCDDNEDNSLLEIEYSIDSVNEAIDKALSGHSPEDIEVNQFFLYEDNFQVELADPQIRSTFESHIINFKETETHYNLSVLNTEITYDQFGETKKDVSEQEVAIEKLTFEASNKNALKNYFQKDILTSRYSPNNNAQIKVYNLKVEDIQLPYPQKVQERMGCASSTPCHFTGTRIRFIIYEYIDKTKPIKFAIDRIYRKEGLYLASTYSSCISRFYQTPERDYYIKQCSVLRDYGLKDPPN